MDSPVDGLSRPDAHRPVEGEDPSDSIRAELPCQPVRTGQGGRRGRPDMGMANDVGVVDTMVGFPHADMKEAYRFITRQTKDVESREEFEFPVEYLFKDVPGKELQGLGRPDRGDPAGDGPVGSRDGADRGR